MTIAKLEKRIASLEKKLSTLSKKMNSSSAPRKNVNAWIDRIHGTFEDNAAYRKAARLGRKWRRAQ